MAMTNVQKQSLYISILLVLVGLIVTGVTVYLLYNTAIQEERLRMRETAQSQASLIAAVTRYDRNAAINAGKEYSPDVTIGQVRDAHRNFQGFGETGEFVLAKQEKDQIVFLVSHRHSDLAQPRPVPITGSYAEPMRLALQGKSGTIIGMDYRGVTVLAAYEPVAELNLGIVVKIDLNEVQAPFIKVGLLVTGITFILVLFGVTFFYRFTSMMLGRVEESEGRLQVAISGTKDGLWLWDIKTGAEWHAPQWLKLLGYSEHEKLPEQYGTWESRIHPDDKDRVLELLAQHLEENTPYDCEHRLQTMSGEYRWFRDRGVAIRDESGQAVRMGGAIQDITDLKLAEDNLRKMSRALDQAGEAIIITDRQGVIEYINPTFSLLTGYAEEDAQGKTP